MTMRLSYTLDRHRLERDASQVLASQRQVNAARDHLRAQSAKASRAAVRVRRSRSRLSGILSRLRRRR